MVSIEASSSVPTAGQPYSLTCSVEVVPHLVVEPSIVWTRQNDGPLEVNTGSGTSLQLNFNPLKASDGDNYTCISSFDIPDVSDSVTVGVKSTGIVVTCKYVLCQQLLYIFINFPLLTIIE